MGLGVRRGELLLSGGFLIGAFALPVLGGVNQTVSAGTIALYAVGTAAATCVRFDVGAGFTVPTQAIFVPMLFAVPLTLVPLLVALAHALGMVPKIVAGRLPLSWCLTTPGNSWFAFGPAIVLLAANDHAPDGNWGILVLALTAQFACDFAANALRQQLTRDITFRELIEEVRPIYTMDLALSPLGLALAFAALSAGSQWPVALIAPLVGMMRRLSSERHERLEQLIELNNAYQGTALLLGDVVEADDTYTGQHCKSVVQLSLDVAEELGLDADSSRNVEFAALLHDVGKIAVPKEIINKPGKLDKREWEIIKTHTIEGQKMLEKIGGFMGEIGEIVRSSHEWWDGSGYPDELSGTAIPIEARIVSACDAFNAMTTTRAYRKAMAQPDAVEQLRHHAGTQFDPGVVAALLRVVASPVTEAGSPSAEKAVSGDQLPAAARAGAGAAILVNPLP